MSLEQLQQGVALLQNEVSARGVQLSGTFDPSADGLAGPAGMRYSQKDNDGNEIAYWKKTGTGLNDWVTSDTGGGGGGPAISGQWDITPTIIPASYAPPPFITPFGASELANVVTTDVGTLTPGADNEYQTVGMVLGTNLNLVTDNAKAHRVRLKIPDTAFTHSRKIIFGFIETALANATAIRAAVAAMLSSSPQPTADYILMFEIHDNAGTAEITSVFYSDGNPNQGTGTLNPITAGVNNFDIHMARFEGTILGQPGTYHMFASLMHNELPVAVIATEQNMVSPLTKTLTPFVAVAVQSLTGAIDGGDISVEIDFTGSPLTLTPSQLGAPFPQPTIDVLIGAPVPILGVETPGSTTQVSTLPVGATVDKLYKAYVNPAFTAGEHLVRPLSNARFIRNGEVVRVTNVGVGTKAVEVVNVWRDDVGGVHVTNSNPIAFGYFTETMSSPDQNTTNDPVQIAQDQWTLTTEFDNIQNHYGTNHYLDRSFKLSDRPVRLEIKSKVTNTAVTSGRQGGHPSGENTLTAYIYNVDNIGILIGTNELYIAPINVTLTSGLNPLQYPNEFVHLHNPALAHGTTIKGLYYKVYLDAAITPVVGDAVSLPTVTSGILNGIIAFKETGGTNAIYIEITTDLGGIYTNLPTVTSWDTGTEIVNITEIRVTAILSKNAIATIDGSSGNTNVYLSTENGANIALMSSTDLGVPVKTQITQPLFNLIQQSSGNNPFATGTFHAVVVSVLNADEGGILFAGAGAVPYKLDYIFLEVANAVDAVFEQGVFGFIIPQLVDGHPIKPDTMVAVDVENGDILVRYINDIDQEVVISLNSDVLPLPQGNIVLMQNQTPQSVINVYTGNGNFTTAAVTAMVAWYPDPDNPLRGVYGKNDVAPIYYVRGVDFDITGNNQITINATFPSTPGKLQIIVDELGVGCRHFNLTGSPLTSMTAFLQDMDLQPIIGIVSTGANVATVNTGTFERPNPNAIAALASPYQFTTPTRGELFTVDEEFDPSLLQQMTYQIKNALARVKTSGTFNGREFLAGNFARWDGYETVPFPAMPPVNPETLVRRAPVSVILTNTGVDNLTRFNSFKKALQYIYNNGKVGTLYVDGTFTVIDSPFFRFIDSTCKISIIGLNGGRPPGQRDSLTFTHSTTWSLGEDNYFFDGFTPYFENIDLKTQSTAMGGDIVYGIFRKQANFGSPWAIGSNVGMFSNTGVNNGGVRTLIHIHGGTQIIRFDKNLDLFSNCISPDLAGPICLTDGNVIINGEGLITRAIGGGQKPISAKDTVYGTSKCWAFDGGASADKVMDDAFSFYRFKTPTTYWNALTGFSSYKALINSRVAVKTDTNVAIATIPYIYPGFGYIDDPVVGDTIEFMDLKNSFATNNFTVVPDTNVTINGLTDSIVFNKDGTRVEFIYKGNNDWTYRFILDGSPITITDLNSAIGTRQPVDSDLTAIAALSPPDDNLLQRKAGVWTSRTPAQLKTDLALAKGDVGLGNVDNTADNDKPISSAVSIALGNKQAADQDLTDIAALAPANDDFMQRKAGAWTNRTLAQVMADLGITKDIEIQTVSSTAFTLTASHTGKLLIVGGSGTTTITIPEEATEVLNPGFNCLFVVLTTNIVTFVKEGTDTLVAKGNLVNLDGIGSVAGYVKLAGGAGTGVHLISGDLA